MLRWDKKNNKSAHSWGLLKDKWMEKEVEIGIHKIHSIGTDYEPTEKVQITFKLYRNVLKDQLSNRGTY